MRHVALLIETSRTYGRGLLQGIRRYASEHGPWSMYVELRALDSRPPAWLHRWKGDGILTRTGSRTMARAIHKAQVPTVELRNSRYDDGFPFVGVDNQAVGRLVADHLLSLGFRNFGVYELDTEHYFTERRETFVRQIQSQGFQVQVFRAGGDRESPRQWEHHQDRLVRWLQQLPRPVGLMACTDQLGYWLLDACARAGIAVPEQAAVIGVENDETLCTMASPQLTSVAFDSVRIGYAAADLLDRMMQGIPAPKHPLYIPPLQVVPRKSSDVMAIDDPDVCEAIRALRKAACSGVSIGELLKTVPVSRSMLERRCRELLGRSPREEMFRLRIQAAQSLLRDTELTGDQIAHRTGFRSAPYFCTSFLKATGCTPGAYRQQSRTSYRE